MEEVKHHIPKFNIKELPDSSFNLFLGKRRSGKSVLCEYLIHQLIEENLIDMVFLFSKTNAGFNIIKDRECRFETIDKLHDLLDNYKMINNYNKIVGKRDQVKIRTAIIIDDFSVELKNKSMNILEDLAVRGRHLSYSPLCLHFFILCQSLTKIPRTCRLNCDTIFFNAIASMRELEMILDENMYCISTSREGKREGRDLYENLVKEKDYQFIGILNFKQNIKEYKDYIRTYTADVSKLKL
jgi:predicted AAA+ superfamily ATPase